jgi:hypothetical protein
VPAFRRFDLTRVCLAQLRRTCDELADFGIRASGVVVADDQNLDVAELLGFAIVRRENSPLGRKFNDGIQVACEQMDADYVVPFGTDNWVDAELVATLPEPGTIVAHRFCTLVHESGEKAGTLNVAYEGGDGVRTWPRDLLEPLRFRPAAEDRERAIDTSIRERMRLNGVKPPFVYHDLHPWQIVSFQSEDVQLNDYRSLRHLYGDGPEIADPWGELAEYYPQAAIDEVREVFARRRGLVAA